MPSRGEAWISSQKARRAFGSTPAVGSSSSRSWGSCSTQAASAEPLLPAARERAGELPLARRQAEPLQRLRRRAPSAGRGRRRGPMKSRFSRIVRSS